MRRAELVRRSVRAAKSNWNVELPARHREHVGRVVHDLIESDQRKAERHEFDDRTKSNHGCADSEPGKSVFTDRRVDDSSRSETIEQPLTDFVSAIVFRDLFAHEENIWIALQFFGERFVERLAVSDLSHGLDFSGDGAPSRRSCAGSTGRGRSDS